DSGAAATAVPILDLGNWNITVGNNYNAMITDNAWPTADEMGRLRMTGTRGTMSFPDLAATPQNMGIVEFYGAIADVPAVYNRDHFWHIIISGGCDLTLNRSITVYGRSGVSDGALIEPVEANYNTPISLMGIYITGAGSSLIANGFNISLYGSFYNTVGAAGFVHGNGWIELLGDNPALIAGNNTFFELICANQSGSSADVGGKIVYFEQGRTVAIQNSPLAGIDFLGDPVPGVPNNPLAPAVLPDSSSSQWVYLVSSNNGSPWFLNKDPSAIMNLQYVYLRDSDATLQPQVVPPDVEIENCPGWVREVFVHYSITRDLDSNGRIDSILVTSYAALKRTADGAYNDLDITVDGYTVTGYADGPAATNVDFYIELEEKDSLDTSASPAWRIDNNTTLIDAGVVGAPLAFYPSKEEEIPFDRAPPIIGYMLAVADSTRHEA
ncbi:MAG: hypothetical protein KAH21_04815, partial [Spirochaetaceae bacterium]|nr:hypothetical protein [Spirochaetaceae bacterium]